MPTVQANLICDNSSVANFISWGSGVSAALANLGLVRAGDTGQVQWLAVAVVITGTSLTANIATYYTSDTTGLRVGQSITVSGLSNNGTVYNITGTLTSVTVNTSFTLSKSNADIAYSADSGAGNVSANVSAVPDYNVPVWEMYAFSDSLQATAPCFLKIYYGTGYWTSRTPTIGLIIGTATNGSGGLTNASTVLNPAVINTNTTDNGGSTLYDCRFSGDTNRLAMMVWRTGSAPTIIIVERSHDTSGNDTAEYIQFFAVRGNKPSNAWSTPTVIAGMVTQNGTTVSDTAVPCIGFAGSSTLLNSKVSVFPLFFSRGGIHNPMLGAISIKVSDFTEIETQDITIYSGKTCNYIASRLTNSGMCQQYCGPSGTNNGLFMRYD